jgi:hypothetical protein
MVNLYVDVQSRLAVGELSNKIKRLKSLSQDEAILIGVSKGSNTREP